MTSQRTSVRVVNWAALVLCLVAVLCVLCVITGKWYMKDWGNGNFPPLVGHLFVIGLGGLMLVGIVSSAVAALLGLVNIFLSLATKRVLMPAVTLIASIVSFVYLTIVICRS